ncbi:hypothetical protein EOM82_07620 [bacterium]|nr:hypothetical protein [bacterium]
MSEFRDLRIVNNFYQTSAFFPMPTIAIGTLDEDNMTSLGAYSLCFPYYIAGKDYYAMLLECRNNSNTAQNILRTGKCSLNFIEDDRKAFAELVRLGFPGEHSKEKMKDCKFTLIKGQAEGVRPLIVGEAYQVMECTWDSSLEDAYLDKPGQMEGYAPPYRNFNGITSEYGAHFILKIDKILMKEKFYNAIINGVNAKAFPKVPVDYGYRDSTNFWYTRFSRPIKQGIPAGKEADLQSVIYAANRIDPDVQFSKEACQMMVKVPRVFLKLALKGCVDYAKENNISLIDENTMKIISDKRSKEKGN